MNKQHPCRGFILSAGRTGTVWLAQTLSRRFPEVEFLHEPPPARRELVLGNLRNSWGVGGGSLRRMFLATRRKRWSQAASQGCVEINPMLCPITDLLEELLVPLRVVHLVRDPRTWAASILRFKASGVRRHVVDFVPFATPYPAPRPAGWKNLAPPGRALWRWRYCNEQIRAIRTACERYTVIRHEDMFSADSEVREQAVRRILDTLDLNAQNELDWFTIDQRVNAAPQAGANEMLPSESQIASICGPLLAAFGYETTALACGKQ